MQTEAEKSKDGQGYGYNTSGSLPPHLLSTEVTSLWSPKYWGGAGLPLGFPGERGPWAAAIPGRRRVRHAWGGGMMRWRSVWMGAGGSGVFSLRCRIGRSAKAMRRCALRRCSCGSARCRRTASEAGRIVFSRDYALWISRLQSGGADPSAPEIERALGRNDPSRAKCRTPCAALLQQCVSGRGFVSGVQVRYVPPAGPHPLRVTGFSFVFRRPKIELIAEKFVLLQN